MGKDKKQGEGPFIKNSEMIGAGNKFEAIRNENGEINYTASVKAQAEQRPSIEKDIEKRKKQQEPEKITTDKTPDIKKEQEKEVNKDKEKQHDHDK